MRCYNPRSIHLYMIIRGVIHIVHDLNFVFFSSLLTFRKIIEKRPVFKVSPVQVLCKRWWHLLFFIQIEFFKNAQKPHKKAVKTDFIYLDREFWVQGPDLNRRPPGYEPDELPDCSTLRYLIFVCA